MNIVSVIVTTYQQPHLLRRCLLALSLQSHTDFELLIADDGSDLRTRAVIAEAVNGFDTRFGYGFEDGDFGARLERRGVTPRTVRWTANALHLWHERPWLNPAILAADREMMAEAVASGRIRAVTGLQELEGDEQHVKATQLPITSNVT